ncbi:MAG: VOC family protein [Anaerolineae bacterium]|nr:VOC family protein [Anaerolineae bacterium]
MPPPSIDQQVIFLYTPNLAQTDHFYQKILGLPLVLDQGNCRIYRVSRDGFVGFCQHLTAPEKLEGIIFTLVTTEMDEWHRYLREKGVEFEKPPTLNPKFNIYHAFLRDPNGYLIEIQQFFDPAWPAPEIK